MDDKFNKEEFLEKEKTAAVDGAFEKVASFNGRMQDPYPSPFLNLSDMQLPQSTIEIFKWCKYYYTFDPLISGAINALATFPVTEINFESDDKNKKSIDSKAYENVVFKKLNMYKLCIEIGIDYYLYGNCFIMGEFGGEDKKNKEWKNLVRLDPSRMIIDYNPSTGEKVFKWDIPQKLKDIIRTKKPRDEYDKIPQVMKEAVSKNKVITLNSKQIYHFSRATDSLGENSVWGVPVVANVLKLLMYRNILRQAQEAIAREHIVPMRIYYIDSTNNVNPMANWSKAAEDLAAEIQKTVRDPNHKVVSPVPVNVINAGGEGRGLLLAPEIEQVQNEILAGMNVPREFIFGGVSYSGSSIALRILENQFITYRLLLEDFIQNFVIRGMAEARGDWLSSDDDEYLPKVKLADLKMQDDVQQKQLIIQLNQAGKVSDAFLLKSMGIDPEEMKKAIDKETEDIIRRKVLSSKIQMEEEINNMELQEKYEMMKVEMNLKVQRKQMEIQRQIEMEMQQQQVQQQAPTNEQAPADETANETDDKIEKEIDRIAIALVKQPPEIRGSYLEKLPKEIAGKISARIAEMESVKQSPQQTELEEPVAKNPEGIDNSKMPQLKTHVEDEAGNPATENQTVDMRPMPEQKPPRRK